MPEVTINLCGQLTVEVDARRCEGDLPGRQGRLALAYLALNHRRPVSREDLILAVWGEEASGNHAQSLNVILSKLRRALGPDVVEGARTDSLQLAPDARVDLEEAAAAVHDLQQRVAREDWYSIGLTAKSIIAKATRGLLVDLRAPWIDAARRDLETLAGDARTCLAQAALALGDVAQAERQARRVVEIDPYRESGYVLWMTVLEAQGNVAEALRVYDRLRRLLRDELGVPPGPRVQAVADRLLGVPGDPDDAAAGTDAAVAAAVDAKPADAEAVLPFFATRTRATFVGRATELEVLRRHIERASAGERQIVLLEGEPGIGKTRLAATFADECHAAGTTVLYGRCDADSLVPYQPFVEAIRTVVSQTPWAQLRSRLGGHALELARVLPELEAADRAPVEAARAETERYRLFEAVSALLVEAARTRTVLLVLDDLHWADRPTLLMVRQTLRATEGARILLLATYRDTEPVEALRDTLADVRREHFVERIALRGLEAEDTMALIRELARAPLPSGVEAPLREETMGNPFFLEELIRSIGSGAGAGLELAAGQQEVPDGIREVLGRRVARLSERTRLVLRAASVIGREFTFDVLLRVLRADVVGVDLLRDLDEDGLDESLEEALAAQVILEVPREWERYTFSHALIRQTLYCDIRSHRRARLHAAVAATLEELASDDPAQLSSLAHHFDLAPGHAAKAVEYAERAARHANRQLAYEQAVGLLRKALQRLEAVDDDPRRRTRLLLSIGDALLKAGETQQARSTFAAAGEQARAGGDVEAFAKAALGHGATRHMAGGIVDSETVAMLTEAIQILGVRDSPLRSRLLARLGIELRFSEQHDEREALPRAAVEIARRLDDPATLGYALIARHWCLWGPENVDERLAIAEDILRLARRWQDKKLAGQGHRWRMIDKLELGDTQAVDAEIAAFARLADERRQLSESFYLKLFRAMRALLAGEFDVVEGLSREAASLGARVQDPNASQAHVLQLVALRREQDRLAEIEDAVEDHVARFAAIPGWRCVRAFVQAELGAEERARAEIDALAADGFAALPLDALWLGGIALLAEAAAAIGDATHAQALYDRLLPYAERNIAIGWASVCLGSASRHLGLLAGLLDRRDATVRHFEDAITFNIRMAAEPWTARTQLAYAEFALRQGDRRHADMLLGRARTGGATLGMTRLVAEVERLRGRRAPVASR